MGSSLTNHRQMDSLYVLHNLLVIVVDYDPYEQRVRYEVVDSRRYLEMLFLERHHSRKRLYSNRVERVMVGVGRVLEVVYLLFLVLGRS